MNALRRVVEEALLAADLGDDVRLVRLADRIEDAVRDFLADMAQLHSMRYREMTPEQKYQLALAVHCEDCDAAEGASCIDRRFGEDPALKQTPHYSRLQAGWRATTLAGLGGLDG